MALSAGCFRQHVIGAGRRRAPASGERETEEEEKNEEDAEGEDEIEGVEDAPANEAAPGRNPGTGLGPEAAEMVACTSGFLIRKAEKGEEAGSWKGKKAGRTEEVVIWRCSRIWEMPGL